MFEYPKNGAVDLRDEFDEQIVGCLQLSNAFRLTEERDLGCELRLEIFDEVGEQTGLGVKTFA